MLLRKIKKYLAAAGLFFVVFTISPVHAEISGTGLTLSPISQDISIQPGQTITGTLKVSNPTNTAVESTISASDFTSKNQGGEPSFYSAPEGEPHAMSHWFHFSETDLTIAGQTSRTFTYTITAPADAEPGGHYGAIFFTNKPSGNSDTTNAVQLNPVVGSLFLVRIPGNIVQSAQVAAFKSSHSRYANTPVDLTVSIKNTGNIHIRPFGDVVIKDWRHRVVASVPLNPNKGAVLPGSIRDFSVSITTLPATGYYTAELAGLYGENQVLSGQTSFTLLPTATVAVTAVSLGVLILAFKFLPRMKISFK
jgi:hypothetical protein